MSGRWWGPLAAVGIGALACLGLVYLIQRASWLFFHWRLRRRIRGVEEHRKHGPL